MASPGRHRVGIFRTCHRSAIAALAMVLALTVLPIQAAHAQTFQIIHKFTAGVDGERPYTGLTIDRAGNLYGTTQFGGNAGAGTAFEMMHEHSSWAFSSIYNFAGGNDGDQPQARLILHNGIFYGTTTAGGAIGYGSVFRLNPRATVCTQVVCFWTDTLLYGFGQGHDGNGSEPSYGDVAFDAAGNLYGTTLSGGINQTQGVVYKLAPSGGSWTESVVYEFTASSGYTPYSGVTFDNAGNLYGTTYNGAAGFGAVYELTPSGSSWDETTIHTFTGGSDGGHPAGGLIIDQSGNLYGTTSFPGTVFKLTLSHGTWTKAILYSFTGNAGPNGSLTMDAAGNLYGITSQNNGHVNGEVFKLTHSGNNWVYTDLHDFNGGEDDGLTPYGGVVLDASGNLYGTTFFGGINGDHGVVWEITP